MGKMDGLVAIVTGASRGLGRAIAKEYASEGAKVVACARSQSPTGLSGTLDETDAAGHLLSRRRVSRRRSFTPPWIRTRRKGPGGCA